MTGAAAPKPRSTGLRYECLATDPGHLIRVGRQLHTSFKGTGSYSGLTSAQFAVLLALSRVPGLDQTAVSEVSALDRSTVSEIVRRLIDRGQITARKHPSDARRQVLFASPEAVELVRSDGRRLRQADEIFLSPLSRAERTWLLSQLRMIAFSTRPDAASQGLDEVKEWTDGITLAATNWAFGRLIRISLQSYTTLWTDHVGSVMTPVAHSVLRVLGEGGALDQSALGVAMSLDKASTAGLVSRMGRQRLVESAVDLIDKRRKIVRITSKGTDSVKLIAPSFARVTADILSPIDEHNREPFLQALRRVTIDRAP